MADFEAEASGRREVGEEDHSGVEPLRVVELVGQE
jgi:hypothetical protein